VKISKDKELEIDSVRRPNKLVGFDFAISTIIIIRRDENRD